VAINCNTVHKIPVLCIYPYSITIFKYSSGIQHQTHLNYQLVQQQYGNPKNKVDEGNYKWTYLMIRTTDLGISFVWEQSTLRVQVTFIYTLMSEYAEYLCEHLFT